MDLFDYISENQSSPLSVKDETYNKIVDHLDKFIRKFARAGQTNITSSYKQILSQIPRFNNKRQWKLNL